MQIFAVEKAFLNGEFTPCEDTAQPLMSTQKGSYMHLKVVNYFYFLIESPDKIEEEMGRDSSNGNNTIYIFQFIVLCVGESKAKLVLYLPCTTNTVTCYVRINETHSGDLW